MSDRAGFAVDEGPLRQWVLKAYHERSGESPRAAEIAGALRQFLSGPPSGPSVPHQYFFERDPDESLARLARELDAISPGLTALVFAPLLEALRRREAGGPVELAPNLSVYVASLAGPVAIRSGLDETVVCAVVAAAILALSRLGREAVEARLGPGSTGG